ncbi:hypothetical protein ACGFOU_30540 [Streptomyces sp. NPDC048595]|uniref:hypothetical protein n=1 Tax=Streptomyces sp. NPDC048595 TaxID=3365576 RepID=UPI00371F6D8C
MRTAVTTPTGNVGRHVVATLVRAGVRPRVLLREPAEQRRTVRTTTPITLAAYAYAHLRHLVADAGAEEGQGPAGSRA